MDQKTPPTKRIGCVGWGLRVLGALIALFLLLFLAAFIVEKVSLVQLPEKYPPPGEMIDVDGYSLHLYCTGDSTSKPVVIVSPGSGSSVAHWALVQPEVAKFARICIYDRLGTGWSFGTPQGQTYQEEAEVVHIMLQKAGLKGPYLLVGASYGGAVMQTYAGLYPQEVAGMVMVDVVTRNIEAAYPPQYQNNLKVSRQVVAAFATPGLFRLMQWFGMMPKSTPQFDLLPPQWREAANALDYNSRMGVDRKANLASFDERNAEFMTAAPLPDVPMIVIARDKADELPGPPMDAALIQQAEQIWRAAQVELASQVSEGTLIVATGSGHSIQFDQPQVVSDAIRTILSKVSQ